MESDLARILLGVFCIFGVAFFVAAEYSFVSTRRSRIDTMSRRGHSSATRLQKALRSLSIYIAAFDIGITMCNLLIGLLVEPVLTEALVRLFGGSVSRPIGFLVAISIVTFVTVVIGEVLPKYIGIHSPERVALLTVLPVQMFMRLFSPLIWLVQQTATLVLKPFGVTVDTHSAAIPKEELLLVVKAGGSSGVLEKSQAEMLARALRLDTLMARDVMVHRLDIQWLDLGLEGEGMWAKLDKIRHTRIPVCRGDIDDVAGIAYLHDIAKLGRAKGFKLESILRPCPVVPENLTLDRIVHLMRESKIQIVLVLDEYGGTSGLITLEDVVEEIFGELEDRLESERPPVEINGRRVSARADVRYDELVEALRVETTEEPSTDTLATILIERLERMPKLGDQVETELGVMRVENMARRRITRVSVQLSSSVELPEV